MRKLRYAAVALAAALLAGCGSATPEPVVPAAVAQTAPPAAEARYNDVDVAFLQMMVAHHGQTLEILKLARTRGTDERVALLAAAIEATQQTELEVMRGWLTGWGEPLTGSASHAAHASHSADGALPITAADEMASLRKASKAQFQVTFLNVLIGHQHNAIEMARTEAGGGVNPQAKDLANRIDRSRTEQIKQLLAMVSG
ncbi:DUF305 domain-containing protein [Catellatospora bangladeshensis]|uniref:Lipoprotein n=1 Tax=Catellatospora bangladeshensis TaxID=310355 RepID=A0A8J3JF10_9ACTN|nr:DUF305 domain-containing protein [Catellatospora bangladeshensis]GIF83316.1 lipoprotein [Catellatospora bangladeshensis]